MTTVPQSGAQLIDPETGRATPVLQRFFAALTGDAGPAVGIDLGSPWTAPENGCAFLAGGDGFTVQVIRAKTAYNIGSPGAVPLAAGDALNVTGTTLPSAIFLPS